MSEKKKTGNANKGFASASPEERKRRLAKSLETRRKNKKKRDVAMLKASGLRDEATVLRKQAELLEQEADALDGLDSSDKAKKLKEAKLAKEITERFGRSVSPQYLKQLIAHSILRNTRIDDIVTPTFAAMDILNHPDSSRVDKEKAIKMLQQFESAKPSMIEEENTDVVGSVEEQMKKLQKKLEVVGPRNG